MSRSRGASSAAQSLHHQPDGTQAGRKTVEPMDELSEYEMERRRTMERNHRKLQELGLVERKQFAVEKKAVRKVQASKPVVAVRRSLRARKATAPAYAEDAVGFDDESGHGRKRQGRSCTGIAPPTGERDPKRQNQALPLAEVVRARPRESKPLPPDSSRNLECDIPMLVDEYLGRSFPAFGKAPVMELSTKSRPPKFSRMSGVTEWKNAVFLWVNVDEGGGYANLFERSLPATIVSGTRVTDTAPEGPPKHAVVGEGVADIAAERPPKCAVVGEEEKKTTQEPGNPERKRGDGTGELAGAREEGDCTVDAGLAELRMTWYAGGRMAPESALIRRLLKCSKTEGGCEASDRILTSSVKPDGIKVERSAVSDRPQQGGEGGTRNTTRSKVEVTTTTMTTIAAAAAVAGVGPNGATPALLAQAHAESGPHKQANTEDEEPSKMFAVAAAAAESAAGEPAGVDVARDDAAAQPERGIDSSSSTCEDAVLLFCRLPKEPYVFCGRLGYAEHWSTERPLRFVWRLLDAGKLALQPDFGSIVEAAGIAGGGEKPEK